MAGEQDKRKTGQEKEDKAAQESGNSLGDASKEAVRFLEQDDEPAHAGRGDAG